MAVQPSGFRGIGPALVTPMRGDGSVDLEALARHTRFCVAGGVHFLVPCGTTGESATLDEREQLRVIEACVEAADGRAPVMAGAGTNSTRQACRRASAAARAGAHAVLSVAPYYNKPTAEGLYRHYMAVADAAGVPVFVYNVPSRTGCNVGPATLLGLARDHELIAGVKEASGDLQQVMTILNERPPGFLVLSGDDHLSFAMMALGADGAISVVTNEVPGPASELAEAALAGDWKAARAIHYRLLPLMRANFLETNPIPVKTALAMMGHGPAHFRAPLCAMSPGHREALRDALNRAGVDLPAAPEGGRADRPVEAAG
ncbi:MAG: 4-hydroxy-tetrahydrodipicolinate synthase [Gemmatimonadota bacterium]|nr:4-hydroxy-tetrahydrodipicolinate synthase [Gemmatimonadota bacterium]